MGDVGSDVHMILVKLKKKIEYQFYESVSSRQDSRQAVKTLAGINITIR